MWVLHRIVHFMVWVRSNIPLSAKVVRFPLGTELVGPSSLSVAAEIDGSPAALSRRGDACEEVCAMGIQPTTKSFADLYVPHPDKLLESSQTCRRDASDAALQPLQPASFDAVG
jgi:hypothetical protein